jgi:hypothetical protein
MSFEIVHLASRFARQIELGKGISLTSENLDLLAKIGVNDLLQAKAAEELKETARARLAKAAETSPPTVREQKSGPSQSVATSVGSHRPGLSQMPNFVGIPET